MPSKRTLIDVAERSAATFYETFFALLISSQVLGLHALEAAGIAGGLAVGKYVAIKAHAFLTSPAAPEPPKPST